VPVATRFVAYEAPDGALAPAVQQGDVVEFEPATEGAAGDVVIVQTPDGRMWMRRLQAVPGGPVLAGVSDQNYPAWTAFVVVAKAVRRWCRCSSI